MSEINMQAYPVAYSVPPLFPEVAPTDLVVPQPPVAAAPAHVPVRCPRYPK